jgi:hypothetical protein
MNLVPQVMISSTFFDLKQVRADLARFLVEQLGYKPLVSEWSSFPIDPTMNTIENCRKRVEQDADILILIIGGRYGYVELNSSASVTNIEYLAARAKGIPIYAFVERKVLDLLPVWKVNKSMNFSSVVEDARVFRFIEEVRDVHKVWMREFDLANEIVEALRAQFAYLVLQGSLLLRRIGNTPENSVLREIRGAPLRIALEKPAGWEYKFLAELFIQAVGASQVLREQMRLNISHGSREYVAIKEIGPWSKLRMEELSRIVEALATLLNQESVRALGPPGEPGDIGLLVFVARSVGELYKEAIEWGLHIRRIVCEEDLVSIIRSMENLADGVLDQIESLGPLILQRIDSIDEARRRGEPDPSGSIVLRPELPGIDRFNEAVKKLLEKLEGG